MSKSKARAVKDLSKTLAKCGVELLEHAVLTEIGKGSAKGRGAAIAVSLGLRKLNDADDVCRPANRLIRQVLEMLEYQSRAHQRPDGWWELPHDDKS